MASGRSPRPGASLGEGGSSLRATAPSVPSSKRRWAEKRFNLTSGSPAPFPTKRSLLAPSVTTADGDRESGTIVVKEASASGAVPLASWHGGLPEIVEDGRTGFLAPERDVATLTRRLVELLRDPALRRRMAEAGRAKMVAEYDNRDRVAELEEAYDAVLLRGI